MFDLITLDRSFYFKKQDYFKSVAGGILTLLILILSILVFYFNQGFEKHTSIIATTEFNLAEDQIKTIPHPQIKIVYGFPNLLLDNLDVVIQINGQRKILTLNDYTDDMWNQFYKTSKNPQFTYKYHYWQDSSFIQVVERIPTKNSTNKPTDFYCFDQTGIQTPIRLNQFGDIECFGTDQANCEWLIDTKEKCETLLNKELKNLNPLSCGLQHFKLWDMDGYSSETHWCTIGRKLLLELNPGIKFDIFDESLDNRKIFMGLEQTKYNDKTMFLEKKNMTLSDHVNANNYVIYLKRKTEQVKVNQGFFKISSEHIYSNLSEFATKLVRKLPNNVLFQYNIVDIKDEIVQKRSKEIFYVLTIDEIAKIFSLISTITIVFYKINKFFSKFFYSKFIITNYKPYLNKDQQKSFEKIVINGNLKDFTLINFLKKKIFFCFPQNASFKNFKKLYKASHALVSIEHLLFENLIPVENKSNCYKFFKKFDILAPRRDLYIKNKIVFQTVFGKILTVFYVGFVLFLFFYLGEDLFKNANPLKIIFNQDAPYNENYKDLYKEVPMAIYYSKWIDSSVQFIYNNRSIGKTNYTVLSDSMRPHLCDDKEIIDFRLIRRNNFVYYCLNAIDLIDPTQESDNKINFGLGKCYKFQNFSSNQNSCNESIDPDPLNLTNVKFGIAFRTLKINEDANKDEYKQKDINQIFINNSVLNNIENYSLFTTSVTHYNWTEDSNLFTQSDVVEGFNVISDNQLTTPNYLDDEHEFILILVDLTLEIKIKNVTRSFAKFLIFWNKVFLIAAIFRIFLKRIFLILSDYSFMRSFYQIYFTSESLSVSKMLSQMKKRKTISHDVGDQQIKQFMKQNVFNLKNHLLMMLCCCLNKRRPDVLNYKIMHEEMMNSLSFERIALNNENSASISFIERFDLLSDQRLLLMNKRNFFKTIFGAILSLLFIFCCIVFGYLLGKEYFNRTNAAVSITSLYFNDLDLNYWPKLSTPVMMYATNVPNYPSYFVLNNQITEEILEIQNDSCTDSFFISLGVTRNNSLKYGCIDISDVFDKIHEINKNDKYFSISVTSCQEWNTFKIFEYQNNPNAFQVHPCPNETIKSSQEIDVGIITKFKSFEKNVYGLKETFIHEHNIDTTGDLFTLRFDLWGNQLDDDFDWFASIIKTTFFTSLTSFLKLKFEGFNNGLFGRMSISFYQNEDYYTFYERRYSKFLDYLVNLMTMVLILFSLLSNFYFLFNEFFYLKHYQRFSIKNKNFDEKKSKIFDNSHEIEKSLIHDKSIIQKKRNLSFAVKQSSHSVNEQIDDQHFEIIKIRKPHGDLVSLENVQLSIRIKSSQICIKKDEINEPEFINMKDFLALKLRFFIRPCYMNLVYQRMNNDLIGYYSAENLYAVSLKKNFF